MTSFESTTMNALEGLLEERRRYEGWLAQLEARRAESPAHVVDRVRSDYQARLGTVFEKLRGRAQELTTSAAALRDRIAVVLSEETDRRDERAELELRAVVGEFEPEQAQQATGACDEAIARLSSERGALESELARITEVLALVAEPELVATSREAESAQSLVDGEPAAAAEIPAAPVRQVPSALETSTLATTEPSALAELAFLQSVVSSTPEPAMSTSSPEGTAEGSSQVASTDAHVAPAPSNADLLPPPVLSAPRRPVTPLSTSIPTTRDPFASSLAASTLTPGSIPSFLKDMPTEQVKTLKCQECGTMNYPTEWYCERCGGELAAM